MVTDSLEYSSLFQVQHLAYLLLLSAFLKLHCFLSFFLLVIDGELIVERPIETISRGKLNAVSISLLYHSVIQ